MKPPLLALLISGPTHAACTWDKPGVDPFQGSLVQAIDHYTDIPPSIRMVLKEKIRSGALDDVVEIRRDSITSYVQSRPNTSITHQYSPDISGMHFGKNKVCETVTRAGWKSDHIEKAKVFCDSGYCLLVPRICNNLSRISRMEPVPAEVIDGGGTGSITGSSTPPVVGLGIGGDALPDVVAGYDYPVFTQSPTVSFNGCCYKPPVSAVPEAHEWLMLLVGLALILWRHHGARTSAN